jgi:hypothetical protein
MGSGPGTRRLARDQDYCRKLQILRGCMEQRRDLQWPTSGQAGSDAATDTRHVVVNYDHSERVCCSAAMRSGGGIGERAAALVENGTGPSRRQAIVIRQVDRPVGTISATFEIRAQRCRFRFGRATPRTTRVRRQRVTLNPAHRHRSTRISVSRSPTNTSRASSGSFRGPSHRARSSLHLISRLRCLHRPRKDLVSPPADRSRTRRKA